MNNINLNQLLEMLGRTNKNDLEKAISQANQIMNSENKDEIINELKKKLK